MSGLRSWVLGSGRASKDLGHSLRMVWQRLDMETSSCGRTLADNGTIFEFFSSTGELG